MGSPFPGMDPYLEAHWLDVHSALVAYSRDELNNQLPEGLIARMEERVAIESGDDETSELGSVNPDVRILQAIQSKSQIEEASSGGIGVALAPIRLIALREPVTERYIKIIEVTGQRLITVIEFVSPSNKMGRGLRQFRRKRRELLKGGVNVVEIDLVRSGRWRNLLHPYSVLAKDMTTYRATIRRPREPDEAIYLHPISLRQPLPSIKIPLRRSERPAELALQPLLDRAYEMGRYAQTINYTAPCDPPLQGEELKWADDLLRSTGKRK